VSDEPPLATRIVCELAASELCLWGVASSTPAAVLGLAEFYG
jgi:hypothetical protein